MATKHTDFDEQEYKRLIATDHLIKQWREKLGGWGKGEQERMLGIEAELRVIYAEIRELEKQRTSLSLQIGSLKRKTLGLQEMKAYRRKPSRSLHAKIKSRKTMIREKMHREAIQKKVKEFNKKWHQQVRGEDKNESDKGQEDGRLQGANPDPAWDQTNNNPLHGQTGGEEGSGGIKAA